MRPHHHHDDKYNRALRIATLLAQQQEHSSDAKQPSNIGTQSTTTTSHVYVRPHKHPHQRKHRKSHQSVTVETPFDAESVSSVTIWSLSAASSDKSSSLISSLKPSWETMPSNHINIIENAQSPNHLSTIDKQQIAKNNNNNNKNNENNNNKQKKKKKNKKNKNKNKKKKNKQPNKNNKKKKN